MAGFCTGCGAGTEEGDLFCSACGHKLRSAGKGVRPETPQATPGPVSGRTGEYDSTTAEGAPPRPPSAESTDLSASLRTVAEAIQGFASAGRERVSSELTDGRLAQNGAAPQPLGWALLACGAVLIVGNWMTWYRASDGLFISEASGNDLSAGAVPIFIIGGILLSVIGVAHAQGRGAGPAMAVGGAIIGVLGLILGWVQADDVFILEDEGIDASIGNGLMLMMLASVAAVVVSVILARRRMPGHAR